MGCSFHFHTICRLTPIDYYYYVLYCTVLYCTLNVLSFASPFSSQIHMSVVLVKLSYSLDRQCHCLVDTDV